MNPLLLILVLFSPADAEAGGKLAERMRDVGGTQVRVVVGAEALADLDRRGIKDSDLVTSPEIGSQLTRRSRDLVVVRLDSRRSGGDAVIETTVWARGRSERHVSIAGADGDALEGASRGAIAIIAPLLPEPTPAEQDARLPRLVDAQQWEAVLQLVAPYGPPPANRLPRQHYYEVMALTRLGRRDDARDALTRMRAAHPEHVLTETAAGLLPATEAAEEIIGGDLPSGTSRTATGAAAP